VALLHINNAVPVRRQTGRIVDKQEVSEKISDQGQDESSGRGIFDSVAGAGGFALAIFGATYAASLGILPSSTLAEKFLSFLDSVALSIAGTMGVGAWRSGKRFSVTVISAGLSITFLAMLSIVAASQGRINARAMNSPNTRGIGQTKGTKPAVISPSEASAAASPSTPATSPTSVVGDPLYLAGSLTGSGSAWENGRWKLSGVTYAHSLGDPDPCMASDPDSVTYQLNDSYSKFIATVSVADNADPIDRYTPLAFEVDGSPNTDGSTNELGTKSAQWHQPAKMTIPLPKGTNSLTLAISEPGDCESSVGVWGNAEVLP
jgi:hypothetical protein